MTKEVSRAEFEFDTSESEEDLVRAFRFGLVLSTLLRASDYQGIELVEFSTNSDRTTVVYTTEIVLSKTVRQLDQLHVLSAESVGITLLEEPGKGWVKDGVTICPC